MQPGSPEENILQELTEPSVIEQGAYILIAAGAFIFIISFLGNWSNIVTINSVPNITLKN